MDATAVLDGGHHTLTHLAPLSGFQPDSQSNRLLFFGFLYGQQRAVVLVVHACMLSRSSHVQLCNPQNSNPEPGSSVHGILQARIPE